MPEPETRKGHPDAAARTHPGARRPHNEDAVVALPAAGLWGVADGMGGHEAGDVASAAVADSLGGLELADGLGEALDQVDDRLEAANARLRDWAASELQGRTLGTTVVLALVRGRMAACLWCGDSRLYHWRRGELRPVTRDHTEVQKMVDAGVLDPEEAGRHPWGHVLSRALGAEPEVAAEVAVLALQPGDQLLLCSDGLYNELGSDEMASVLARADSAGAGAEQLLNEALERGARDNVSVIVVRPAVPADGPGLDPEPDTINARLRELYGRYRAGSLDTEGYRLVRRDLITGEGGTGVDGEEPTGRHPGLSGGRSRWLLAGVAAAALLTAGLVWLL